MRIPWLLRPILGLLFVALPAVALDYDPLRFVDPGEVRPGTVARALTVFEGIEPVAFEVTILGVLPNAVPGGDLVMIRLRGEQAERSGVVAGMSGSPVYVGDRLLGAISYSFPFAKEPIGMVTPIRAMIEATNRAPPRAAGAAAILRFPPPLHSAELPRDPSSFAPVATPLMISGGTPEFFRSVAPLLQSYGLMAVQAGGGGAETAPVWGDTPLGPGSSVAIPMVRGDFEYAAVGTVTYREGDDLLAFGHPLLLGGLVEFPIAPAWIHATIPSVLNSFKIGSAGPSVGALIQDRQAACLLRLGLKAHTLPLQVTLRGLESLGRTYRFEVAQNQFFTPMLLLLVVSQTLLAEGRTLGPSSYEIRVQAEIEGQPVYRSRDLLLSGANPLEAVADALGPVLQAASGSFEPLLLQRVSVEIDASEERRTAIVRRLQLPRRVVAPGESLSVEIGLDVYGRPPHVLQLPFRVPVGTPSGPLRLAVYDRIGYEAHEAGRKPGQAPESIAQLFRAAAARPAHDELRLVLEDPRTGVTLDGRELAALPPTVQSLLKDDLASGRIRPTTGSILFESSIHIPYLVSGSQTAELWVSP